jgi:hypothetical protein
MEIITASPNVNEDKSVTYVQTTNLISCIQIFSELEPQSLQLEAMNI